MQFDVVIPSTGHIEHILRLLGAIDKQTVMPEHIFLIVDKHFSTAEERQEFAMQACGVFSDRLTSRLKPMCNISHDFVAGQGASYVRNYGINLVKSPYLYLLDQDNMLDEDFFEKSMREYESVSHHDTVLYSPLIGRRETDRIQSAGIRAYHYRLARPEPMMGGRKTKLFTSLCKPFRKQHSNKNFYYPEMIGGNSLFGKAAHFKHLQFDDRMPFIYEDIDLTHRRYRTIGPIVVSKTNVIHHMERDKTKLDHSFLATPEAAYQKAKNRILFVKNNATSWQKVQFFGLGLRINNIWFTLFILFTAKKKGATLSSFWKGTIDGLKA